MSILACLAYSPRCAAAETVSARTIPDVAPRSSSILSNTVAAVEVPESVFVDRPQGKDPFFPDASYRKLKIKKSLPDPGVGGDAILQALKLTGFGGTGTNRWAMINGVTIYENESSTVRVAGASHQILCLEMKDESVIVGIKDNPAQRELKLDK